MMIGVGRNSGKMADALEKHWLIRTNKVVQSFRCYRVSPRQPYSTQKPESYDFGFLCF
jgi:hypothetical protein